MGRVIGWFRRLIDEPDDLCLERLLEEPTRAPSTRARRKARRAVELDLAHFDERVPASSH